MKEFENEPVNYEEEAFLEGMNELLKGLPKNAILVLNVPRYIEVNDAITRISNFVTSISPDAKFKAEYDPFVGTGLIFTIIADELSITKTKEFAKAISVANTMSVVPVKGGNIEIGFTFNNVRIPAPPITK